MIRTYAVNCWRTEKPMTATRDASQPQPCAWIRVELSEAFLTGDPATFQSIQQTLAHVTETHLTDALEHAADLALHKHGTIEPILRRTEKNHTSA